MSFDPSQMGGEVGSSGWLKAAPRRIHLIGVSGSGMIGLARLLLESGHQVSGSDLIRAEQTEELVAQGLKFEEGHDRAHVREAELVIYSTAIKENHVERVEARDLGIPQIQRARGLAALADARELLIVCGTHGKTTSTVMLTAVLKERGLEPGFYIGADTPIFGASASAGKGAVLAAEADESDGSIRLYHPWGSLILNIEEDHLDYYADLQAIMEVFQQVVEQSQHLVVACVDDENTRKLIERNRDIITYGLERPARFEAYDIALEERGSRFRVRRDGTDLGDVVLTIPGRHNVSNATGVMALAMSYGVSFESCVRAMARMRGASRRFDVRFQSEAYLLVDDYAHHPTEIQATLAAARGTGRKRVVAAFQPHRYSRSRHLQSKFGAAFREADVVVMTDIYGAGEKVMEGVDGRALFESVRATAGDKVHYAEDLDQLKRMLGGELSEGDCVLTMGAGNIHEVCSAMAEDLRLWEEMREVVGRESVLRPYESMKKHTSLRVGGAAQYWFEPANEEALAAMFRFCGERGIPVTMIGRGTNLLVRDRGIRGVCIHLGQGGFKEIRVEGDRVWVGAGARLKDIVYQAKKAGLGGFEFMEGIPGNVGGALRMNAGAMQSWITEVVETVRTMDPGGQVRESAMSSIEVAYRDVALFEKQVVLGAVLRGQRREDSEISAQLQAYSKKRWSSQPAAPSAGCTFKNSEGISSGKLIEELGLKDTTCGGARISPVHANFIVNDGGATAEDILKLVALIKEKARLERGIELELEVKVLGE
ncbi:MAG: UDP-N-acetylmuramate--L-alanine ligase [Blastochloris sp.]|nr:UDP-N-acetylmuramate--L-alanine ligase [Blastochloris sp.]